MSHEQTSARASAQPLVFRREEPLRPLRRFVDASLSGFAVLFVVVLFASGSPGPLLVVAAIALAVGSFMRAVAWFLRRRDGESTDPRREILLWPSLVGRVQSLQRAGRRGEAAKLLRSETDLSLSDTARALELIRGLH